MAIFRRNHLFQGPSFWVSSRQFSGVCVDHKLPQRFRWKKLIQAWQAFWSKIFLPLILSPPRSDMDGNVGRVVNPPPRKLTGRSLEIHHEWVDVFPSEKSGVSNVMLVFEGCKVSDISRLHMMPSVFVNILKIELFQIISSPFASWHFVQLRHWARWTLDHTFVYVCTVRRNGLREPWCASLNRAFLWKCPSLIWKVGFRFHHVLAPCC